MLDLMLIPNMLTSERIAFLTHGWLMGAPAPLLWSSCSHLPTLYRNEGTNEVTIVPNTVDAYVSGILIDDDLTQPLQL